jgi:hypothetical protein
MNITKSGTLPTLLSPDTPTPGFKPTFSPTISRTQLKSPLQHNLINRLSGQFLSYLLRFWCLAQVYRPLLPTAHRHLWCRISFSRLAGNYLFESSGVILVWLLLSRRLLLSYGHDTQEQRTGWGRERKEEIPYLSGIIIIIRRRDMG